MESGKGKEGGSTSSVTLQCESECPKCDHHFITEVTVTCEGLKGILSGQHQGLKVFETGEKVGSSATGKSLVPPPVAAPVVSVSTNSIIVSVVQNIFWGALVGVGLYYGITSVNAFISEIKKAREDFFTKIIWRRMRD